MNITFNGTPLPATSSRPDLEARYLQRATPDACRAAADEINARLAGSESPSTDAGCRYRCCRAFFRAPRCRAGHRIS